MFNPETQDRPAGPLAFLDLVDTVAAEVEGDPDAVRVQLQEWTGPMTDRTEVPFDRYCELYDRAVEFWMHQPI